MIYVTDSSGKLLDDLQLRKLILSDSDKLVKDLMSSTVAQLSAFEDRENAVKLMKKYDLVALPVIDSNGVLVDIVTVDDVMDVAEAEATEDIHKAAAISPLDMNYQSASVLTLYSKHVVWLVTLVIMNLASAIVIGAYEDKITELVMLLFFIPILIASGGNTGSQSSTLIIRAMVTGNIKLNQWFTTFVKELSVGMLLGVTLGIVGGIIGIFKGGFRLDIVLTVGLAMSSIVFIGNCIGMILPFVIVKCKQDPAIISGPLITTIADATGLLIYFSIASFIIIR